MKKNRKVALISDIHGNLTAFKAVLKDANEQQVTDYWILGDVLLPGPGRGDLLQLLRDLPNLKIVRGNWDDCFLKPKTVLETPQDIYIATLNNYQKQGLTAKDIEFYQSWPLYELAEVNGVNFIICHNLPDCNFGGEYFADLDGTVLQRLFPDSKITVAVHGHTHFQRTLTLDSGRTIINPGSVGHPYLDKNRASGMADYGVLHVDSDGCCETEFRKIPFSVELEREYAAASGLPYLPLYLELLETGKTYTHDFEFLKRLNEDCGYEQELLNEVSIA